MKPTTIMHVEVGGSYGGSLRALELYLKYCDRACCSHDLLLYYPVEGMERLRPLVRCLHVLEPHAPRPRAHFSIRRPSFLRGIEPWLMLGIHLTLARRLARIFRASRCSLVHCNNTFSYQAPTLLAARWAGLPVAAHIRNPFHEGASERWLAKLVPMFLTLHAGQEEQLQHLGVRGGIVCCPDGIELPSALPSRANAIRRQWLPEGGLLLGSLGRLDPQKAYDELISAAARVLPRYPNARLAIFGEGSERQRLEALIVRNGLQGRTVLAGFTAESANVLASLDLFVCSSRWEGVPLSVLEAMLASVPVVATQAALAGDARLQPLLAAPAAAAGPEALAAAMDYALRHREEAQARAATARALVERAFAPGPAAARLDAALLKAVAPNAEAPAGPSVKRLAWLRHARPGASQYVPSDIRNFYETAYCQPRWQPQSQPTAQGSRFTKMWYRAVERHVLPRLDLAGCRVLEVGCGFGWLAPLLDAAGARFIGVDLAESALRQFPRKLAAAPVLADACRLPFPRACFDVILCLEVLEHIPQQQALLAEIFRVAAPGATVIVTTPSYSNFYLPLKLLADAGSRACRRYLTHQPIDHLQFAFPLRSLLARYGRLLEQRAIRLHPPFCERLDARFGPGRGPARLNDWLFDLESRRGASFPWRYLGLHTCFVLRAAATPDVQGAVRMNA